VCKSKGRSKIYQMIFLIRGTDLKP